MLLSILKESFPQFYHVIKPLLCLVNSVMVGVLVIRGTYNVIFSTDAFKLRTNYNKSINDNTAFAPIIYSLNVIISFLAPMVTKLLSVGLTYREKYKAIN